MRLFICRAVLVHAAMVASLFAAPAAFAQTLTLSQNGHTLELVLENLRSNATFTGRIVDPFDSGKVDVRGYELESFWRNHFAELPNTLKISAHDGYEYSLEDWQGEDWLLITHIDGEPLTLRSHGPVRLMQKSIRGRDPESMRAFPDWVWMIHTLEGQP